LSSEKPVTVALGKVAIAVKNDGSGESAREEGGKRVVVVTD